MYSHILKTSEASKKAWLTRQRNAADQSSALGIPMKPSPTLPKQSTSEYSIEPYKYAKDSVVVKTPSPDGYKTRASRLAGHVNGRYSHRAQGYVMSPAKAAKFKALYEAGRDASSVTGTLDPL